MLDTDLHLSSKLRMSGAVLRLYGFVAWTGTALLFEVILACVWRSCSVLVTRNKTAADDGSGKYGRVVMSSGFWLIYCFKYRIKILSSDFGLIKNCSDFVECVSRLVIPGQLTFRNLASHI